MLTGDFIKSRAKLIMTYLCLCSPIYLQGGERMKWKAIKEDPYYMVSDEGHVKSLTEKKFHAYTYN